MGRGPSAFPPPADVDADEPPAPPPAQDDRDEAMANKCPGGMMDCDGDRREYAKEQYKNFEKKMTERAQQKAAEARGK